GDGGEVGRLDERVGGHLGDEAGDAVALAFEEGAQAVEVEDVAVMQVIAFVGGDEFFEQRDGVEVEPAELNPPGASAGALAGGGRAEAAVDGVHAAGGEEDVGGVGVEEPAEVRADLGGRVAGKQRLGLHGAELSDPVQVVLGLAGGEEGAGALQEFLGAGGKRRIGGEHHRGQCGVGEYAGGGRVEVRDEGGGGLGRGGQPDVVAGQTGGGEQLPAGGEQERMHHEARIT